MNPNPALRAALDAHYSAGYLDGAARVWEALSATVALLRGVAPGSEVLRVSEDRLARIDREIAEGRERLRRGRRGPSAARADHQHEEG